MFIAPNPDDNKGPSPDGEWATKIPEHSMFTGIIEGCGGIFWKSDHEIRELREDGRGIEIGYHQQLGVWVDVYRKVPLP
jgi:hypothetical protein